MAVIGTFGSFTTARLGIYASQASLQVTGNNIANINTNGYTRQRADLVSLNSTGTAKYANPMGVDIGYGVLVKSTTQLRDPYLDIRFRNENTKLGAAETTLAGLNKVAQTLDEVNKGGEPEDGIIEHALKEFKSMLQDLGTHVGSEEYDGLVREAAKSLTTFFNTAAKNLQEDWDLQADELRDTIKEVNSCLTSIRNLNEQIRKQGLYGDLALELRDSRNLEIDKLSSYMGINVEYSMERIDQFTEVEKLTITLKDIKDARGNPVKLVDGLYAGQFSFSEVEVNPNYSPKYEPADPDNLTADDLKKMYKYLDENGNPVENEEDAARVDPNKFLLQIERLEDKFGRVYVDKERGHVESVTVPLGDTDLTGSVQAMRELLTEEGEFASRSDVGIGADNTALDPNNPANYSILRGSDPNGNIKKGIPYYQKRLDLLAQKFAEVFNEANQQPASLVYEVDNAAGINLNTADADKIAFVDKAGRPITDEDGNVITLDMVTKLVDVLDSDGSPVKDDQGNTVQTRVPLGRADGDAAVDAAKYLAVLRDKGELVPEYSYYDGGVLFSNSGNNNDPTGINAMNISIANSWAARTVRVLNSTKPNEGGLDHSSDNSNIDHLISLFERQLTYSASELEPDAVSGGKTFLHGSFGEVYTDIGATLAGEQYTMAGTAYNYEVMTLDIDNSRASVSGVDLNDEATSMMQFQKSYQAACRLLTTIDSMLDTLINGTAR